MNLLIIVLIVILLLGGVGTLPNWSGHQYGYAPSGAIVLIVVILLILALTGRL